MNQPPVAQGLYDPANEHDACGVGFVAHIKGKKSHSIVEQGLQILKNLTHRGAVGADPLAGLKNGETPLMVAAGMGAGLPGRVGSDRRNRTMDTADSDADIATLNKDLRLFGSGSGIEAVKLTVALGNDVNAVALNGDTALHAAAGHGYDSVIRFLVEKRAKLDAKNKRGLTPLNVAEKLKDADDPTIGTTTVAVIRELLKGQSQ